ncbi:MAG: hypothetical protein ACRBB0_15295 [Pelagimonas sp.]|uniref:hypothetical protein n=1 Tax=Pelagimonas sp. TaxID=2073170 RepID=UPI003D6BC288
MSAASAKSLFRATKPKTKPHPAQLLMGDLPEQRKPDAGRDPLDYDPTPPDATEAFLAAEADHMRAHGNLIWENAVGAGHMARVFQAHGFDVTGTDLVDRGWPGVRLGSFYDFGKALAPINVTNPPYCEINARDGHGRWLFHSFDLGLPYIALLLNADWCAARINGMDRIFEENPPSVEYLCCWKIDFRGGGSPPQRNSFFVWDVNRPPSAPNEWRRVRLYRDKHRGQGTLL